MAPDFESQGGKQHWKHRRAEEAPDKIGGARGGVPKWPKGADCKSAALSLQGFESSPHHQQQDGNRHRGDTVTFVRSGPSSSVVERILGKNEVESPILSWGLPNSFTL